MRKKIVQGVVCVEKGKIQHQICLTVESAETAVGQGLACVCTKVEEAKEVRTR